MKTLFIIGLLRRAIQDCSLSPLGIVDGAPYWKTTTVAYEPVGASHENSDYVRAYFFGGDVLTYRLCYFFALAAFSGRYSIIGERVPCCLQSQPMTITTSCLYVSLNVREPYFILTIGLLDSVCFYDWIISFVESWHFLRIFVT